MILNKNYFNFFFRLNKFYFINNYFFYFLIKNSFSNEIITKTIFNKKINNLNFIKLCKFIFLLNFKTLKQNSLNFYLYKNNKNLNFFNNNIFFKNLVFFYNFIFYSFQNKINFLILESNKNNLLFSLYNYMFSYKNLFLYKNFFFNSCKHFTHRNWIYFYQSFLFKFNVKILIIMDLNNYINYVKDIKLLKTFLISLVFIENIFLNIDVFLYTNKSYYYLLKYLYLLLIINSFFLYLNFKKIENQFFFLKI